MNNRLPRAVFIMGPTASGKTELATQICERLPCEIISVDSAMIYRGMNIGTAKPKAEVLKRAPHHLIDILSPKEVYSASDFRHDALEKMKKTTDAGKIPVLVGGTMLYFKVLLKGLSPLPKADVKVRAYIARDAQLRGWKALHHDLQKIDPKAAQRIHPNDPQRLSRALEVFHVSGQTLTALIAKGGDQLSYNVQQFAIAPRARDVLNTQIKKRFHAMLEDGFESEVQRLLNCGDLHANLPSIRCVGYRQMWSYLQGEIDYEEMQYRAVVATQQLSKRQMTWLKNWQNLVWLEIGAMSNLDRVLSSINTYNVL